VAALRNPSATVLVVDDDEGVRTLMRDILLESGYRVTEAGSGVAALRELGTQPPDLLLLDLKLNDMPGQAVLNHLRGLETVVPFVVITGQGDEKVAVELMREGARDYVRKDSALFDLLPGIVDRALRGVAGEQALVAETRERRRLEAEIIGISEAERRRIGQDLHDGLGQQLTAVEILCTALKADLTPTPALAKQMDQISQLLRESIGQVRALARGLVPVGDEPDALWNSLVDLAARTDALGRVRCRLAAGPLVACGDREIATQLYRIAQEAVNNAVKHGDARQVTLTLTRSGDMLELAVRDDGRGGAGDRAGSLGLRLMRHRASLIGGEFSLSSPANAGTEVRCRVPLPA